MSPEATSRVVGRCTDCGELVLEVTTVTVTPRGGIRVDAGVVRRCGCGEFVPADSQDATPE